jgi:hypothetical protein
MFNRNNFDHRFDQSQRRFNTMFRVITTIIVLGFTAILAFWIFAGFLAYKAADGIGEKGVRGVVEQLWCGKSTNCELKI